MIKAAATHATPRTLLLPAWQVERARRLHKQFQKTRAALDCGQSLHKALRPWARLWQNRCYSCDPNRKCAFSLPTLLRLYRMWKIGGETPEAVRLRFEGLKSRVPASLVLRFAKFCAQRPFANYTAAYQAFSERTKRVRRRRGHQPLRASYGQMLYTFPAEWFKKIQAQVKARADADRMLGQLLLAIAVETSARRGPRRRRRSREELSLSSASL